MVEISRLGSVQKSLMWDSQVMLPVGGHSARSQQVETLAGIIHSMKTSDDVGSYIKEAEKEFSEKGDEFNCWEKAVLRDARIGYNRECKVPVDVTQEIARLNSIGPSLWHKARVEGDSAVEEYNVFLQNLVDLQAKRAAFIDDSKPAYDVLMEDFERGFDSDKLQKIFSSVKEFLVPFIKKIADAKEEKESSLLPQNLVDGGNYSIEKQKELCEKFAIALGFDMKCGRLDVSAHPFTNGTHPTDVRITTRYKETSFIDSITGTIHETGHGIFEQNLPYPDGFPVFNIMSMGLHESQSLLYERMVGLSQEFWNVYWQKLIVPAFPSTANITAEQFYGNINMVQRGLIRVEADECTYPIHVILRMEIEKALIEGNLKVADLPKVWNVKMKEYLGVDVPSHKEGYLQDLHWAVGYFGYFPTYLLGAMYAVQIYEAVNKGIPNLPELIAKEEFGPLKGWLNENIHSKEVLYDTTEDVIEAATGSKLDHTLFLKYLERKYSKLYHLK